MSWIRELESHEKLILMMAIIGLIGLVVVVIAIYFLRVDVQGTFRDLVLGGFGSSGGNAYGAQQAQRAAPVIQPASSVTINPTAAPATSYTPPAH